MRPKEFDVDPDNESLTGLASNVTGAGPWTPTTTAMPDGLAHQVSIRNDTANDHSAKTITLVGTDADGEAQTETLAGPNNAATVESAKYYKTLTSVSIDATIGADTFDIGWVDEVVTQTYPIDWRSDAPAAIAVDVTGTINFTVQQCLKDIQSLAKPAQDAPWMDITALASKTADTQSTAALGATAIRLKINSYSAGAEAQMQVSQPSRCG